MPINEHRRLVKEARAIIDKTRLKTEALTTCVGESRVLVAESRMLLARSEPPVPQRMQRTSRSESGGDPHCCTLALWLATR